MSTIPVNIKFSGLKDIEDTGGRVRVLLHKIESNLDPELLEALLDSAEFMRDMAKVTQAPHIDTGSLYRSIRVERTAPTRHHHQTVRVRAGGYIVNPKTRRRVDYAGYHERQYPYMQPAWEMTKPMVDRALREAMERVVHG